MEEFLTLLLRTFPGDSRHSRSAEKKGCFYLWQVSPLSSATQPDSRCSHSPHPNGRYSQRSARWKWQRLIWQVQEWPHREATWLWRCHLEGTRHDWQEHGQVHGNHISTEICCTSQWQALYDLLLHKQPIPAKAWLPSSAEPSSPEKPASIFKDPLPGTVPGRIGTFVYPPKKRLRRKTSDDVQASCFYAFGCCGFVPRSSCWRCRSRPACKWLCWWACWGRFRRWWRGCYIHELLGLYIGHTAQQTMTLISTQCLANCVCIEAEAIDVMRCQKKGWSCLNFLLCLLEACASICKQMYIVIALFKHDQTTLVSYYFNLMASRLGSLVRQCRSGCPGWLLGSRRLPSRFTLPWSWFILPVLFL